MVVAYNIYHFAQWCILFTRSHNNIVKNDTTFCSLINTVYQHWPLTTSWRCPFLLPASLNAREVRVNGGRSRKLATLAVHLYTSCLKRGLFDHGFKLVFTNFFSWNCTEFLKRLKTVLDFTRCRGFFITWFHFQL